MFWVQEGGGGWISHRSMAWASRRSASLARISGEGPLRGVRGDSGEAKADTEADPPLGDELQSPAMLSRKATRSSTLRDRRAGDRGLPGPSPASDCEWAAVGGGGTGTRRYGGGEEICAPGKTQERWLEWRWVWCRAVTAACGSAYGLNAAAPGALSHPRGRLWALRCPHD